MCTQKYKYQSHDTSNNLLVNQKIKFHHFIQNIIENHNIITKFVHNGCVAKLNSKIIFYINFKC